MNLDEVNMCFFFVLSDLGDGFGAVVATTFQVGGGNIKGRKTDCLAAAWTSTECVI